jgi:hypothetical protein
MLIILCLGVCSKFAWAVIKEALGWQQFPSSLEEFTQV